MKEYRPIFVLGIALVLFLILLSRFDSALPERVVAHFNESGKPDGRMPTDEFLSWMVGIAVGFPVFLSRLLYLCRFLPPKLMNTPYPEYWREAGNFRKACDVMFQSSLYFNAAFVLWCTGHMALVVQANLSSPIRLNMGWMMILIGFLLIASLIWTIFLTRFFLRRPPADDAT